MDLLSKIKSELELGVDKHSKKLISANIELFLSYCERFYDRQFITREDVNMGILEKFETLLNNYFYNDQVHVTGLPSVAYCAEKLNLSSNYFGDLIKKQTGKSAQEYMNNPDYSMPPFRSKVCHLFRTKVGHPFPSKVGHFWH